MADGSKQPKPHAGGPEGVNPFWDDPKNEGKNMNAVEDLLEEFEKTLGENEQLVFALGKSDNRNAAAFVIDTSRPVDDEKCITTLWIIGDAKHRQHTLQKRGEEDTGQVVTVPLNALEKAFLGCSVDRGDEGQRMISLAAFDEANFEFTPEIELVRTQGTYWLRSTSLNGQPCRLERAYVQMARGTTRRLDVLSLYGTDMEGNDVSRKLVNSEVA